MNTSATGGYLTNLTPIVTAETIEDELHKLIYTVCGIDKILVRPAFQGKQPKQPSFDTDWCAFSLRNIEVDEFTYTKHDAALEIDSVTQHQNVELFVSFYGPEAVNKSMLLRNGFGIRQNRDELRLATGLAFRGIGTTVRVPELVNDTWVNRVDQVIELTFESVTTYKIFNLLSDQGVIAPATESETPFLVEE